MSDLSASLVASLELEGRKSYGDKWRPQTVAIAPGRIELIGNHLDYNGGPVLAAAINRHVVVGIAVNREFSGIRVAFTSVGDGRPEAIALPIPPDWRSTAVAPQSSDYLRGVIATLTRSGYRIRSGIDLLVAGNLEYGIGISSSAALCISFVHALAVQPPSRTETILIAQEAEHRAGSPCGTMDQSAIVHGGLIRFDGSPYAVESVEADLAGYRFVVVNSGVVRSLATSTYPIRVRETSDALDFLRREWRADLLSLASIAPSQLESVLEMFEDADRSVLARRVRHVVTECQRVREAELAVTRSDWQRVGSLMTESGRSSATDYEVSHARVEHLVRLTQEQPGVLGARMMGGGEGGSALVLVVEDALAELAMRLERDYFAALGAAAPQMRTLVCNLASSARTVVLPQAS